MAYVVFQIGLIFFLIIILWLGVVAFSGGFIR